jgi:hypothetical protein
MLSQHAACSLSAIISRTPLGRVMWIVVALLICSALSARSGVRADEPSAGSDVEKLKRRIEELENQNGAMLQMLVELDRKSVV